MKSINLSRPLLLGAGLLCAAPLAAKPPLPPVPLGNPGEWVRTEDYPTFALRNNLEGITAFVLAVDSTGWVSNCQVSMSSGSEVLDETACRLIAERARFSPATDKRGKAVSGTYASRVIWQIPKDEDIEPPVAFEVVSSVILGANGAPIECRIEKASGAAAEKKQVGTEVCPADKLAQGYTDAAGNPVAKRLRHTIKLEILDVTSAEIEAARQRAAKAAAEAPPAPLAPPIPLSPPPKKPR